MANSFFNINRFRSTLASGARPNLFKINLTAPTDISDPEGLLAAGGNFSLLCRSAAIPSYTIGVIEVPFRGRRIKLPGDRTYGEWTVTVINDQNQGMRKVFDNWLAYINNPDGTDVIRPSAGGAAVGDESSYRTTVSIDHYRSDGSISRKYALLDAFPTDVSAIDLSYDTTDAIQEFTVTFNYHYLDVGGTSSSGTDATEPSVTNRSTV
jgi:hypothetical protein